MISSILLLILGFALLKYGAEYLVTGAKALALRFKIPEIIIGLTVVAIGTSAPEVAVSVTSALRGMNGLVLGNIIGSNIANILLVLGITALIATLPIKKGIIRFEMPFVILITILMTAMGYYFHSIGLWCGLLLLIIFILFMMHRYTARLSVSDMDVPVSNMSGLKMFLFIVFGLAALVAGSDLTVSSAVNIAHYLHISDRIIGLTVIALGTSLPELVVCIVAALHRHPDLAIGNVLGSNIFNILFILGMTAVIEPVEVGSAFVTDSLIACLAVVLLMLFVAKGKKLSRTDGVILCLAYIGYIYFLVGGV